MTREEAVRALCQLARVDGLTDAAIASPLSFDELRPVMVTVTHLRDQIVDGVAPDTEWLQRLPEPLREAVRQLLATAILERAWRPGPASEHVH